MAKNEKRAMEAKEVEQVSGGGRELVKGYTRNQQLKANKDTSCILPGTVAARRAEIEKKMGIEKR